MEQGSPHREQRANTHNWVPLLRDDHSQEFMVCSGAQEAAEKKNKSPDFNTDNIQESMISHYALFTGD